MNWYLEQQLYNHAPVAVQNALVSMRGRRIYRERFCPEYEELARFLEDSERQDPERLRAYQERRLRELVRHAYETVPHYRETMDARGIAPEDIGTAADLARLPVLTKSDVARLGNRLASTKVRKRSLRRATTSATTGSPLSVSWDRAVTLMNHACYMRARRWAGVQMGRPYATLQGRILTPIRQRKPPFWRDNPAWNQTFFSPMHMSEENLVHYVAAFRRKKIRHLEAYPSTAYVLARFLRSRDDYLPLECVITTGEPLLPMHRELLEERFDAEVFDAYGQAERVTFSSECEEHNGHHLHTEYGITELVDESGAPVPIGTHGRMVGTSLHNFAMPLIRYACGDMGAASDRTCACGRTLPLLESVTSREGDTIVTPEGRVLPAIMMSWTVRWLRDVEQWQIRQVSPSEIHILVVAKQEITGKDREHVTAHVHSRMGAGVKVHLEKVDEIPRSAGGKLRHVVSEVPIPWGEALVEKATRNEV
jgi:phenylacetate-CoA ligase